MSSSTHPWDMPQDDVILAGNEVHVWKASLQAPLSTINSLQGILSEEEVKRAGQFYFEKDRLHWIVAHGILRMLLGHYLDSDPRRVGFVTNGYGKPFIAYPSHGARLRFNLSHSGDLALYAFTYDRHIGVDVEYMRADIDYEKWLSITSLNMSVQYCGHCLQQYVKKHFTYAGLGKKPISKREVMGFPFRSISLTYL